MPSAPPHPAYGVFLSLWRCVPQAAEITRFALATDDRRQLGQPKQAVFRDDAEVGMDGPLW